MNTQRVIRPLLQRVCMQKHSALQSCRNNIGLRTVHHHTSPPSLLRTPALAQYPSQAQHTCGIQRRYESTAKPLTDRPEQAPAPEEARPEVPSYEMTFTCRVCVERSTHKISKQGYHKGTILITCPGCKNRHLISDHLKIFSDKSITLEDILKEKGQLLKKGALGEEGDVEFWEDGSQTSRTKE